MKIENILLGQAVRLLNISNVGGGTIYGVNLTKALQNRYGFLEAPRTLAEYDFSKGVTFSHGYFRGIVIDRFQIYNDGVLADGKVNTDICEAFLDDLLKWIREEAGIVATDKPESPRIFGSNLEVHSPLSLPNVLPAIGKLAEAITDSLRSYGLTTPPELYLSGLSLSSPLGPPQPFWRPPAFKFERREGSPESSQLYFSMSGLRTSDHLKVLTLLESLLTSAPTAS